jgi:hypothetical protein
MNMQSVLARRATTIVIAAVAAGVIRTIAVSATDIDLAVGSGTDRQEITLGSVIGVAVIAGLAAIALAAILARKVGNPRRTWQIIANCALAASLAGPMAAHTTPGSRITLVLLHLVVGATLIIGINGTLRWDCRPSTDRDQEKQPAR